MKFFIAAFVLVCATLAYASKHASLEAIFNAKFQAFKAKHGKTYQSKEQEKQAKRHFLEATRTIELHNEKFHQGQAEFLMSHNQFSDMSHEEFKRQKLGFRAPPPHLKPNGTMYQMRLSSSRVPISVDWRGPLFNTIKNQGECGSCYSFATTGALEGALMRKFNKSYDLSEQNLVDCSAGKVNNGCDGGLMTESFAYIKRAGGINSQADYPYVGVQQTCKYDPTKKAGYVNSFVELPEGDEKALTHALANVGPIAVAIDASPRSFMMYSFGIYSDSSCNPENLSHAVLAVGYGNQNGREYFIIKNSWGDDWGEKGYFRIARNRGNMCGVASMTSYPVV